MTHHLPSCQVFPFIHKSLIDTSTIENGFFSQFIVTGHFGPNKRIEKGRIPYQWIEYTDYLPNIPACH